MIYPQNPKTPDLRILLYNKIRVLNHKIILWHKFIINKYNSRNKNGCEKEIRKENQERDLLG
jgi:hypothetical protein